MNPHTPGWKTSEFWLTLAGTVVSAVIAAGIFDDVTIVTKILSATLAVLSVLGYQASRTVLKMKSLDKKD
jgi:hypothetical protein